MASSQIHGSNSGVMSATRPGNNICNNSSSRAHTPSASTTGAARAPCEQLSHTTAPSQNSCHANASVLATSEPCSMAANGSQ